MPTRIRTYQEKPAAKATTCTCTHIGCMQILCCEFGAPNKAYGEASEFKRSSINRCPKQQESQKPASRTSAVVSELSLCQGVRDEVDETLETLEENSTAAPTHAT